MRSAKAAYVALPLLVATFAAILTFQLCGRSAIPASLHAEVHSITVKDEHPGTANAWFVRIGDHTRHLDQAVGEQLTVGDRVAKDDWKRTMTVNGRPVALELGREARAALWFAPLLTLTAAGLSRSIWRTSNARKNRAPTPH